jgi:hypothetical protein
MMAFVAYSIAPKNRENTKSNQHQHITYHESVNKTQVETATKKEIEQRVG